MGVRIRAKTGKKLNKKRYLLCLLAILITMTAGGMTVNAVLQNDKSTSLRSVHMQDAQIEASTLIIGSHLIHIEGLTDKVYETAMESANEFSQYEMYYKSELSAGAWFEISQATSIADITTSGKPVEKSVIEGLEFTHKTDANGVVTDLRTGQTVSIYDIPNPYDLMSMEELEPLRLQYQILQEKTDKGESDEIYLEMVSEFFGKSIQNETTNECDVSLKGLEEYKNGLSPREKPSMWNEKTEKIMTSVDAERRVVSLSILADYLDMLENDASGMAKHESESSEDESSESSESEEEVTYPELTINSEIVAAIGDCIKNVEESISAYEAKKLTDSGETASAKAEYRYSQELITKARNHDTPGCDELMEKLCDLQNILDGVVSNQERELNTLKTELVQEAYQKYVGDLKAGASEKYKTAQAGGTAYSVLSQYLTEQKNETNTDRLEYQTMLDAQFTRMDNTAVQSYILQLIDGVPNLEKSIQQDAAHSYLAETVAEHLEWLRKAYAEAVKNSADASEMSKLEKEKEELSKKRQDALDNNNLSEAEKLTAEMEAKQKDIDNLAANLNNILNSPNSSETDKAKARAALGDSNTSSLLANMAGNLTSAIRSEDANGSDLLNQMEALAAAALLDPSAGAAALEQVQEALDGATGPAGTDSNIRDQMETALNEASANVKDALENGGELSAAALENLVNSILDSLFGVTFEDASASQQAAAIVAMEWYGTNQNNEAALSIAASLIRKAAEGNNPFIYDKLNGKTDSYMSLYSLGKTLNYRYIFDDAHNTVTLQKGKEYYLFTLAKTTAECAGESSKELKAVPEFMTTLYIHNEDSNKIFETKAEYIQKASQGVVGTPAVESLAQKIYENILEGDA